MTLEERQLNFIEKCKAKHPNENLDYSKVCYTNNRTHVIIIDHDLDENGVEYGEFKATPSNLLKGQSHPRKRGNKISSSKSFTQEDVIKRFKEVHKNENLDYSQVVYKNMHTKVKIISHDLRPDGTEYGEFWQEPCVHLKGCTHPEIGVKKYSDKLRYTTETFIEKAKKIYGDKYDYSKVNYVSSKTKVCVICNVTDKNGNKHGEFFTSPDLFLMGKSCPKCGNHLSYGEDEIYDFIVSFFGKENVIKCDKKVLDGKEIDIYIPSKKIGFEFNGIRWHSEKFNKGKYYHLEKRNLAKERGITLIHIFEDEYLVSKKLVLDKIATILGVKNFDKKIPARKCDVREIDFKIAKDFLEENHIQGFCKSTVHLGCYYNEELVGVMSFLKESKMWNLTRFATKNNYLCQGVASKIFKHFTKNYNPDKVKSFLDLRWCFNEEDNLYTKLGFIKDVVLKPDYKYTNGSGQRQHKFAFRKSKLNKKYGLPLTMTETEMVEKLGYYRIWDCGLIRYLWMEDN